MRFKQLSALALLVVLLLFGGVALAGGNSLNLSWHSFSGGGGRMSGSSFVLDGSIVRSPAGVSSAGEFSLTGGFQAGFMDNSNRVFLPSLLR